METHRLLEGTLHHAVRAACGPAPSAAMTMADRPGAIRHAVAPALAAEDLGVAEDFMAVAAEDPMAAGTGNRSFIMFLSGREIQKWRTDICSA